MTIDARDFLDSVAGYANSSSSGAKSSSDRPVRLGTIDVNYTSGTPKVLFDGESTISDRGYSWVGSYAPVNGERVFLIPVGQSYIIGGKLESSMAYNRLVQLPLQNGWLNYDIINYHAANFTKTETGLVKLGGLMYAGTQAQNQAIARLPEGFRPNYPILVPILSNQVYGSLLITPDGFLITKGFSSNAWITLANIVFPTAELTWYDVTLQNSFTVASEAYLGLPQYAKDAQGRVWFRGAVGRASAPAPDTNMFTIPAGYRPNLTYHLPACSYYNTGSAAALIDVQNSGNVRYKTDTASMSTISLAGVMYCETSIGGWINATYQNGWVSNDAAAFNAASYRQDADGTVHIRGLVRSGTLGTTIFNLPAGMRPARTVIRVSQGANVTSRIDILPSGNVIASLSSNTWQSLDGISFTPEI